MSDAATPAVVTEPITPTPTPATPAQPAAATVTLTKEQHDQLQRDAARAGTNQSKADRFDRLVGSGRIGHFTPESQAPKAPPTEDELAERTEKAKAEDTKAERGLMRLATLPEFRAVLDADPTLRDLLTQNPLAVLPTLAPDALDAEDAVALVTDALKKKAQGLTPATPPVVVPPVTPPATPPAGGVNPPSNLPDAELETIKKNPNTEQAVAGMVKHGLRKMGGKSS